MSIPTWPLFFATYQAIKGWRRALRYAAAIPAIVLLVLVGKIIVDTSEDPTSHNLWPLEIIIRSLGGLLILGALALFRSATTVEETAQRHDAAGDASRRR